MPSTVHNTRPFLGPALAISLVLHAAAIALGLPGLAALRLPKPPRELVVRLPEPEKPEAAPRLTLPPEVTEHMRQWRCGSGTFRMNVALSELPDFTCLPGRTPADHHTAGIIIAPTLAYMERAYFDARSRGWSQQPIVELVISSTLDDTLAPPGQHVASLFCQHVAPTLPNGDSWDAHREAVADLMIDTVNAHAPNFRAAVLGRQIMSPLDLERTFGLIGGDISHGNLSLDQLFSARPMLGFGNYRGPLRGLYMCGAGTHPGGGVSGAPGHNAAREVLSDFRRGRLRRVA